MFKDTFQYYQVIQISGFALSKELEPESEHRQLMGFLSRKVLHGWHKYMLVEGLVVGLQRNQRTTDNQASSRQ